MEIIFGIVIIIVLSYLGAHKSFTRLPLIGDVNIFFLTGTEFLIVGILLGPLVANMISENVITGMYSFVGLGLGWLGMLYGLQFNVKKLIRIPPGYLYGAFIQSVVTFIFIFTGAIAVLQFFKIPEISHVTAAILLASVGSCSSQTALALIAREKAHKRSQLLRMLRFISSIGDLPGLVAFGIVFCLLQSNPLLSGKPYAFLQWFSLTVILGTIFGWITIYLLHLPQKKEERLLFTIGIVLFSGGIATYLRLSPLFVNFIAGVFISNFYKKHHALNDIMLFAEKPIYLILLILAGSMWSIRPFWAFGFTIIFLLLRVAGKITGTMLLTSSILRNLSFPRISGLGLVNQGGMALAMVINYQMLFKDPLSNAMISIFISSILFSELLGQRLAYIALSRENRA